MLAERSALVGSTEEKQFRKPHAKRMRARRSVAARAKSR